MPTITIVSFRLGGRDGVSVEAAKWAGAFSRLGWQIRTVAGAGTPDVLVPGLGLDDTDEVQRGPTQSELDAALRDAELVVVENLCSLPLNPIAARMVARTLETRPAVLHHHDLPWQRPRFASSRYGIPDSPTWRHVTINDLSRDRLAERGIKATTIRNAFNVDAPAGDRIETRAALGLTTADRLVLQPTRAIARKNIPAAIALARAVDATFWLLGPAEEGYGQELATILGQAERLGLRTRHGVADTPAAHDVAHAYAAADMVTFPSLWEGFGNPVIESAIYRRALAIAPYPVSRELASFGFRWLDAADHQAARDWFDHPEPDLIGHNFEVAREWFSLEALDAALAELLAEMDLP